MSGWLMGLPARILALGTQLDSSVIPAIRETPWKYTTLPTAGQAVVSATSTAHLTALRCTESALAGDTTLQTLVDVTGSGFLEFASVWGDAYSGTVRLVIKVDGSTILDTTGASVSDARLLVGAGSFLLFYSTIGYLAFDADRIPFRSSLQIQAQQSDVLLDAKTYTRYSLAEPYTA